MPSKNKTYYYCRVFFDYFNSPVIANILRKMNGADVVILHQKLIMLTANTNNVYHYYGDDNDADHVAELAYSLRIDPTVVKDGIEILFRYGLAKPCEGGIYIPLMPELIDTGSITSEAIKKRKQREKKAPEGQIEDRGGDNVPLEIDKDIELELDTKYKDNNQEAIIIIDAYNNTFGSEKYKKNSPNIRKINKALEKITFEQAIQIIGNEHARYVSGETGKFFPNITWMFGGALDECLNRIQNKQKYIPTPNQFNRFRQNDYDFSLLEKEILSN